MAIRARRALIGLATTAAVLALPAAAMAAPGLTVTPSTTTAGSSTSVDFDATFSSPPNDVSFALPAGLLANANQAGGACLSSTTAQAACQVGSGTVNGAPVTLYLVAAPKTGDAAGLALVQGPTTLSTADVTVSNGALNIAFSGLSGFAISDMNVNFTSLRLPTSCPSPAASVTLTADGTPTTAPLNVTGCSGLPYAPALTANVTQSSGGAAALTLAITQAANQSANSTIVLNLGGTIAPNVGADLPCLAGTSCKIGTATATSPLVPSVALANGTVTLGGSTTTPTLTVSFPAPFAITISGTVSLASNSVTFAGVPDVPLSALDLDITGPNGQSAFTTTCAPASIVGDFTAQGGQTFTSNAAIAYTGCVAKPTASGAFSGLAAGHPKLKVKATKGKGAGNFASVSIGLPSGLKFSRSAFVTHTTCVTKKGKKKCTTTTLIKGLGISGATVKSVALKSGKLVIALKKPGAGSVTVNLSGPVLTETSSLQTKVKKHKVKTLTVNVKIGSASVPLKLTVH